MRVHVRTCVLVTFLATPFFFFDIFFTTFPFIFLMEVFGVDFFVLRLSTVFGVFFAAFLAIFPGLEVLAGFEIFFAIVRLVVALEVIGFPALAAFSFGVTFDPFGPANVFTSASISLAMPPTCRA